MLACVSRMQTAALSALPEPRRMASRPVDSIAATMLDGATVPVMDIRLSFREAETLWMPANGQWTETTIVNGGRCTFEFV